jgi:PAS domain S-box-containing protein
VEDRILPKNKYSKAIIPSRKTRSRKKIVFTRRSGCLKKYLDINHYVSVIALLALIPILLLGFTLTFNHIQEGENLKRQHLALADHLSGEVQTFLNQHVLALETLAAEMKQLHVPPEELKELVGQVAKHYPGFSEVYVETAEWNLSSNTEHVLFGKGKGWERLEKEGMSYSQFGNVKAVFVPVETASDRERNIFFIIPFSARGSSSTGMIVATLNMEYLDGLLQKQKIYPSGYSVLVDANNRVIYHPAVPLLNFNEMTLPVISALRQETHGTYEYYSPIYQRTEIASFVTLSPAGWGLWVAAPRQEVIAPVYKAAGLSLGIIILGIIVIVVIRHLLIVNISKPLKHLNKASSELAQGNLAYRVHLDNSLPLEIYELSSNFNVMAQSLEEINFLLKKHGADLEHRVKTRTRELVRKNKELAALYAVASSVSSTNNLMDVLRDVLEEIKALFGVEISTIFLKNEEENELKPAIWRIDYPDGDKLVYTDYTGSFSEQVIKTGTPIIVDNMGSHEERIPISFRKTNLRSLISVPIIYNNNILGAITLSTCQLGRFSQDDLSILQAISSQLGVVISNVSLFNKINQEHHTFLAVINSMHEGLILVDTRQKIVYANPVFLQIFHLENASWQGLDIKELYRQAHPEVKIVIPVAEMLQDYFEQRIGPPREAAVTHRGKTSYYLIQGFPVSSSEGFLGYGYITRDITREKEVDFLKNSILSTVSHELRTPLTTIRGSAESLLRQDVVWNPGERDEFIHAIVDESQRLRELIDNIMDMSKIEAGVLKLDIHSADVTKVINRVINRFQQRFPEARITTTYSQHLPFVPLDERRIEQVLNNLLENAIKYSPLHQVIHITAEYLPGEKHIKVSVADQGIGIAKEHHQAIFERFYRVNSSWTQKIGGSGVGLAIAKGIIEAHGGSIWVESSLGHGSKFYFTIPCELIEEE